MDARLGYCTAAMSVHFQTGFDHTTRSLLRTRMTTFVTIWLSNSMQVTQSIQRTFSDNKFSSKKYTFGDPFSDGILRGSTFGWSPTEGWTVVLNKYILMFHLSSSFFFIWIIDLGSRGGAIVRALAFRQCGPGSNSGVDAIGVWVCCWFSPFSPCTSVFPLPQKPRFLNSNLTRKWRR